jgi:BMFP domain-containing protein YqiC
VDRRTREELISENALLKERLAALEAEVEMLREKLSSGGGGGSAAPFIKPNRAERRAAERAERKKRKHSFARKRDFATREVRHAVENCPDCGRKLIGGWIVSKRQTIEIPQTPIEITDHVLIARKCGVCGKVHIPKLGIADGVVGKARVGPRLMSLIATLAIAKRMPQRSIQKLLAGLYGVHISLGEITEILHKVAGFAKETVQWILRHIRGSPHAHGDETGWRENGINGYLWSLCTPELRYFHFDRSRASRVAKRLLGLCFGGVLVCDFYGGYSFYDGPIQRCWVHFLRDLKKLLEAYPDDANVRKWVESVRAVYKIAKKIARRGFIEDVRVKFRQQLEAKLMSLAQPYLKDDSAPQRVLAQRIEKHLGELFTFVEYVDCPSGNNAAERAIRPAVIARKISGGTRSEEGSRTRTTLMSVFGTWTLQGKDLLAACTQMIVASQTPTAIVAQ